MTRSHHIKFTRVRWKNLFSYGNTWTEVDLSRSPSTLITGKNGGGKSVLFEALHILLTGSSIRPLKKVQWVNNKNNKGMLIEGEFSVGEDEYKVCRGVKPDLFTIEKNGTPMLQEASVREMQTVLNRDILRSDKIGLQITSIISKSGIQMFMSLKADERRKFIDNMLGCGVFTEMSKLHKSQFDALKTEIEGTTLSLTRQQALNEGKERELEGVIEMAAAAVVARKSNYERDLKALQGELAVARKRVAEAQADVSYGELARKDLETARARLALAEAAEVDDSSSADLKDAEHRLAMSIDGFVEVDTEAHRAKVNKVKELEFIITELQLKKRRLEEGMDSLKEGFCTACKQDVGEEHIKAERAKIAPKLMETESILDEMVGKINVLRVDIAAIDELIRGNSRADADKATAERDIRRAKELLEASRARVEKAQADARNAVKRAEDLLADSDRRHAEGVEDAERTLGEVEAKIVQLKRRFEEPQAEDNRAEHLKDQLEKMRKDMEALCAVRDEQARKAEYFTLLATMLKDGGVKTVIVKRFLPIVNRLVNEKLMELGFFAKFTLDENFDEEIIVNAVPYTFHQFSEGEKLRINLALIMAWREIARMQGRMDCNLLMFDEQLDGSLDDDGYEALTDIFKLLDDLNVFIISHNPTKMENFVRSKMAMAKKDGFSKIVDVIDA